jgi:hypothetical protein
VLDLYARRWEGKPLGAKDFVISADEKTSIQATPRYGLGRTVREVPSFPHRLKVPAIVLLIVGFHFTLLAL